MKVSIVTLGCKVNEYESRMMYGMLKDAGYDVSEGLVVADAYILNSCAVTSMAEKKSRQTITKLRKLNPNSKIIVCGCAGENNPSQFDADSVIGTRGKTQIISLLSEDRFVPFPHSLEYECHTFAAETKSRQYIKVQEGCNNFCSYCIISYLRGRSRSRELADIVREVTETVSPEVVLTGINTSDYRIDGQLALTTLVQAVARTGKRFRLGSLEVNVIDDGLLEALKQATNFCPHFHLSLQSGCDSTLKRMNRKYTTNEYAMAVEKIRSVFGKDASISTDVIVGFKGETDEEFDNTYNFLNLIQFSFMHIFPFSPRKGTVAYNLKGDVINSLVSEREKKLEELNQKFKQKFIDQNLGKPHSVLVEKIDKKYAYGYTDNYIYTRFVCDEECADTIVNVVGDGTLDDMMLSVKE